jgi:hypothetical protein
MPATSRRLRQLTRHVSVPLVAPAAGVPSTTVQMQAKKLTDEQMAHFLSAGYLVVPVSEVPKEFHETIYEKTKKLYRVEEEVGGIDFGNNIFPAVPELGQIFRQPSVVGALTGVLGHNYCMHPHRHMHSRAFGEGGRSDQNFHMDSYWGMTRTRHHVPRWCMCLYFPHDVVLAAGPTGIVPYSQYWEMPEYREGLGQLHQSADLSVRDAAIAETVATLDPSLEGMPLLFPGGTVVMMAYDVYHRGCRRLDELADWRAMYKFQFFSTEARTSATWEHDPLSWPRWPAAKLGGKQSVVWDSMFEYCLGERAGAPLAPLPADVPATAAGAGTALCAGATEAERMGAAYAMARMVRGAVPAESASALGVLGEALESVVGEAVLPIGQQWRDDVRRAAMYGLSAAGPAAVPLLMQLAEADPSVTVRIAAVHALSDAVVSPDEALVRSILAQLQGCAAAIDQHVAANADDTAQQQQLKLLHATILQTLGFLGQQAAAMDRRSSLVQAIVAQALLPALLAPEPAASTQELGLDHAVVAGQNTSRQMSRQNAAIGLLALCTCVLRDDEHEGSGLLDELVSGLTVCTTDEDRYVMACAACCLLALCGAVIGA